MIICISLDFFAGPESYEASKANTYKGFKISSFLGVHKRCVEATIWRPELEGVCLYGMSAEYILTCVVLLTSINVSEVFGGCLMMPVSQSRI